MRTQVICDGRYLLYDDGRIWSLSKQTFLRPQNNGTGYMKVLLRNGNKAVNRYIHRLVASAFIPNPNEYPEVNHIDGDKTNNRVDNLEWCSSLQNKRHAAVNNLTAKGERNAAHKLTEDEVKEIRRLYKPFSSDYNTWTLAKRFNVSQTTIRFIVNGNYWRNVAK